MADPSLLTDAMRQAVGMTSDVRTADVERGAVVDGCLSR